MTNSFCITTPVFYVNDVPHIGHAYTIIACDVVGRFKRLQGIDVKLLTGSDEHGQKIENSAKKQGKQLEDFVTEHSLAFQNMMSKLNISDHDFIRTTETRHKKAVKYLWNKLLNNGYIYKGNYAGWYSTRDEAFYSEKDLTEEGLAPSGSKVEWIEEPSYFFSLSKFQDKLLSYYENHPDFIIPKSAKNEIINFLQSGLTDLSISRSSFKWGIEVPNDPEHIIYVWLDALTYYISALGYPEDTDNLRKYWPATHVVGKDIIKFHAIFWPAFLMAADLPLPESIVTHGWWTNEGEKISKSLGNTIDPIGLVDKYGLDPVRYFLMREITFGKDGNFAHDNLVARVNSELSNKIGNLLQRVSSFVFKECQECIPQINQKTINDLYQSDLISFAQEIANKNITLMDNYSINQVIDNIISIAERANLYIDQSAPWSLKKTDREKMFKILYNLLELLRYIGIMLQPFIPNSAAQMLDQIGVPDDQRMFKHLTRNYALEPGGQLQKPVPIFPRIEK